MSVLMSDLLGENIMSELMSELHEAYPSMKWEVKSDDEHVKIAIGYSTNGLSIEVSRSAYGYYETYASVFLDGELVVDEPIEDETDDTEPNGFGPVSKIVGFAVGCALFSRIVEGRVSPDNLAKFEPWVQECLTQELERRREWAQGRFEEARGMVDMLKPYLRKTGKALTFLRKQRMEGRKKSES